MKYDEFAFANRQLASMLRAGIPLEGALRQLAENMSEGGLRGEIQQLEKDLGRGIPLQQALAARKFPDLYVQTMQIGVESGDLPAVLTLLADYYQNANSLWVRLKGLMIYPLLVLIAGFLLSSLLFVMGSALLHVADLPGISRTPPPASSAALLILPMMLACLLACVAVAWLVPRVRSNLRWRLPGFKEAALSQFASAMEMMLRRGSHLDQALGLLQELECGSPAGKDLEQWRARLAEGQGKMETFSASSRVFPKFFVWLVSSAREDLASGFAQAATIYRERAFYKIELALYAALPVSILLLSVLIISQLTPAMRQLIWFMDAIGDLG